MSDGVQLTRMPGSEQLGVIVDGRFVGEILQAGDCVIWRPWFFNGSIRMSWTDFCTSLRRLN